MGWIAIGRPSALVVFAATSAIAPCAAARDGGPLVAVYVPEAPARAGVGRMPPSTFDATPGAWRIPLAAPPAGDDVSRDEWPPLAPPPGGVAGAPGPGGDFFIADGAETALAINPADLLDAVALLNQGFLSTPSMRVTSNGNVSWTTKSFPNGSGTYTGSPYDPWAASGNADGTLLGCLIRRDTASNNTHCVVARSVTSGSTWSLLFEEQKAVVQDRQMFDVDRTTVRGGGPGTMHDDKIYLFYDNYGFNGSGYVDSVLQVVDAAGGALSETSVSTPGAGFRGAQWRPVAGAVDGQSYACSLAFTGAADDFNLVRFHEFTNGGTTAQYTKSTITWARAGQELAASNRWGLNGHRVGIWGDLDVDRTSGPRHGWIYYLQDRNPNPTNATMDQGTLHLSISTDGATTWSTAEVPGQAAGKTQYFTMIDVDDNGWIHVAYYQNDAGTPNNGVLNASTANLYYTYSTDSINWAPHIQVNSAANVLDFFNNPPLDLASDGYYLIGDYQTLRAMGTGANTVVYILWTGYDKDRNDVQVNNKRERVICTKVSGFPDNCLGDLDGSGEVDGADLGVLLGGWGVRGPADLDGSGVVDGADLGLMLGAWGDCPG